MKRPERILVGLEELDLKGYGCPGVRLSRDIGLVDLGEILCSLNALTRKAGGVRIADVVNATDDELFKQCRLGYLTRQQAVNLSKHPVYHFAQFLGCLEARTQQSLLCWRRKRSIQALELRF